MLYITCAGVGETIQDVINELYILDMYSKEHNLKIIVVGCLLINHEYLFERFKSNPNIKFINKRDWIIPTINYLKDMNKRTTWKEKMLNRTYFLDEDKVEIQFMMQQGCSNKCSFCKVNYNSHELKSLPFELALDYLKDSVINKGTKIICLDGDNLTLYGVDLYGKQRLHEFIHELSLIEGLELIYVNELVAGNMYDELLDEIITNPKVVSVSMQLETASDRLLKLMNRNYTLERYDGYAKKIIDSGKYIDTILMSGFPTETKEDMDKTLKYLYDRSILIEGICEYSDFEYIPSSKLEQFQFLEKRRHTRYLVNGKIVINHSIALQNMHRQNRLIYLGKTKGNHYFNSDIPLYRTISNSKRFDNLKPGDIINETPKRLVKKCSANKKSAYKI